jgi:hypothetical protein
LPSTPSTRISSRRRPKRPHDAVVRQRKMWTNLWASGGKQQDSGDNRPTSVHNYVDASVSAKNLGNPYCAPGFRPSRNTSPQGRTGADSGETSSLREFWETRFQEGRVGRETGFGSVAVAEIPVVVGQRTWVRSVERRAEFAVQSDRAEPGARLGQPRRGAARSDRATQAYLAHQGAVQRGRISRISEQSVGFGRPRPAGT